MATAWSIRCTRRQGSPGARGGAIRRPHRVAARGRSIRPIATGSRTATPRRSGDRHIPSRRYAPTSAIPLPAPDARCGPAGDANGATVSGRLRPSSLSPPKTAVPAARVQGPPIRLASGACRDQAFRVLEQVGLGPHPVSSRQRLPVVVEFALTAEGSLARTTRRRRGVAGRVAARDPGPGPAGSGRPALWDVRSRGPRSGVAGAPRRK